MSDVQDLENVASPCSLFNIILDLPTQTQIGMALFAVTWMVGGNVLIYYSMKRRGIPIWKVRMPSIREAFGFSAKEWLILGALAVLSFPFAFWGMSAQEITASDTPLDQAVIEAD